MASCNICGKESALPYRCGYCRGTFCSKHRLPESHSCEGLEDVFKRARERGRIYRGVSEHLKRIPEKDVTRESVVFEPERGKKSGRMWKGIYEGSLLKSLLFRRVSMIFLAAMFLVFIGQVIVHVLVGPSYIYYLAPSPVTAIARPWTLITSIFAHGGPIHLVVNGIVLFFLGPQLEGRIGMKRFIYIFLGAGILAGITQLIAMSPSSHVVLGASGAILGVLGTLTVLAPQMLVLLFFFIPVRLWMITIGYLIYSGILAFSGAGGPIAHMAHFSGILVGLIYGYGLRREAERRYRPIYRFQDEYRW